MNRLKQLALGFLIVVIGSQFVQPVRNQSEQDERSTVAELYGMSDSIYSLFRVACFDCHSNNTDYPWYSYVQPVGWLIERDINEAKDKLNFGELGSLSPRRQMSKWRNVENRITDGTMPLSTYQLMHPEARLTEEERLRLVAWIQEMMDNHSSRR